MKKWMQIMALALAFSLLFAGCKKDDAPEVPDQPPAEQPQTPITPETPVQPETPEVPKEEVDYEALYEEEQARQYAEDHTYWLETMSYFVEDGWGLVDAQQLLVDELNVEHYYVWLEHMEYPGLRTLSRRYITLTPDGKDYQVKNQEDDSFGPAHQAIMNYRILENARMGDAWCVAASLGFVVDSTSDVSDIAYTDFYAAMMRTVTPELYERRFAALFSEKDGKLVFHSTGGSSIPYIVDALELQQDGSYLVYLHGINNLGGLEEIVGHATLETLPNGSYVVASWADEAGSSYGADQLTLNEDGTYTITPAE